MASYARALPRLALLLGLSLTLASCGGEEKKRLVTAPPPPTFTGPEHLHGTVGSFVTLRNNNPLLISGFGMVVNLPGTGGGGVPRNMRPQLVQDFRKLGLGDSRLGAQDLTADEVLDSRNTALVIAQGVVPPGAVKGSRFDVLVSAHPATETTNLQAGRLWTTNLGVLGANQTGSFVAPRGKAAGPVYVDPLTSADGRGAEDAAAGSRTGVIVSGGLVMETRYIQLILNQPSWTRSGEIADRINERFRKGPEDRDETAIARSDSAIELRVPVRYGDQPERFVQLVQSLHVQGSRDFLLGKAKELAELLEKKPTLETDARLVWEANGRNVLPVTQPLYESANNTLAAAALEAGSRLGDGKAVDPLLKWSSDAEPSRRKAAANLLRFHSDAPRAMRRLTELLNDPDRATRLEAYESLLALNDPAIHRQIVGEREEFKFILDLVPSDRPLVYVNLKGVPRLAIFSANAGFKHPLIARLWNNRLMVRGDTDEEPVRVFYQDHLRGTTEVYAIAPTIGNLAFVMAHKPSPLNDAKGFDLSFSQVVNALHALSKQGLLLAEFHVERSPLADRIAKTDRDQRDRADRPESDPVAEPEPLPGTPGDEPKTPRAKPVPADPEPTAPAKQPDDKGKRPDDKDKPPGGGLLPGFPTE
jgi:hypothetical protein